MTYGYISKPSSQSLQFPRKGRGLMKKKKSANDHFISSQLVRETRTRIHLQSSSPSLPVYRKFVTKRTMTTSKLMTTKVIPTADIRCAREGGSTKFGGSPLGFEAMGIFERSMLDGKDCIAAGLKRIYRAKMTGPNGCGCHKS